MDGLSLISIRHATDKDNQVLLNLELMCPQGTGLVLQFDRSPDFFLRSKAYDNYSVYVAEEQGQVVGTAASTIKEFGFGGKRKIGLYVYDVRVHPDHCGKGTATRLIQHALTQNSQAQIAYAVIVEDNSPSIAVFTKLGFQNIRDILLLNIPLYKRRESAKKQTRTMTTRDIPQVVNLINSYYGSRDFFSPLDATDFADNAKRLPGYSLEQIQVTEAEGEIVASAGLWDYSQIFRITALRVSAKLRALAYLLRFANIFKKTMRLPRVGEPFRLMYVKDFACKERTGAVEELIEHCLCVAHNCGCSFLSFPLDPDDAVAALLTEYKPITAKYHIYARSLTNDPLSNPATIYMDPVDL